MGFVQRKLIPRMANQEDNATTLNGVNETNDLDEHQYPNENGRIAVVVQHGIVHYPCHEAQGRGFQFGVKCT